MKQLKDITDWKQLINEVIWGDCLEGMKLIPDKSIDLVLTDPPYPNNAGHFDNSVKTAEEFIKRFKCNHWMIFWDEMTMPPCPLPLVAKHIWHRSNTNRPDNYEMIYEFHADGVKRASRVLKYAVIYPGLTGCYEATGHPTQKNTKLMQELIEMSGEIGLICDPFMGSWTTARACKDLGRNFIGFELEEKYCKVGEERLRQELLF